MFVALIVLGLLQSSHCTDLDQALGILEDTQYSFLQVHLNHSRKRGPGADADAEHWNAEHAKELGHKLIIQGEAPRQSVAADEAEELLEAKSRENPHPIRKSEMSDNLVVRKAEELLEARSREDRAMKTVSSQVKQGHKLIVPGHIVAPTQSGNFDEAEEVLDRALKTVDEAQELLEAKSREGHSVAPRQSGNSDEAEEVLDRVLKMVDEDEELLEAKSPEGHIVDGEGHIVLEDGNFDDAEEFLDRVLKTVDEDEELLEAKSRLDRALKSRKVKEDHNLVNKITFLRIQKTGSTTFADKVMALGCGMKGQMCYKTLHYDWLQSQNSKHIVTMLRDPVERTISEFYYLQDNKWAYDNPQWDYPPSAHNNFKEAKSVGDKLWSAIANNDIPAFLAVNPNPAVNRQTLYLAGFKPEGINWKHGIDWEKDGQELLEKAKEHLRNQRMTFGLTDEYVCSMKLFAKVFDWPQKKHRQHGSG